MLYIDFMAAPPVAVMVLPAGCSELSTRVPLEHGGEFFAPPFMYTSGRAPATPASPVPPPGQGVGLLLTSLETVYPLDLRKQVLPHLLSLGSLSTPCDAENAVRAERTLASKLASHGSGVRVNNASPVGLENLKDTCFISAVLQALRAVTCVRTFFTGDGWAGHVNFHNPDGFAGRFVIEVAALFHVMDFTRCAALAPATLVDLVRSIDEFAVEETLVQVGDEVTIVLVGQKDADEFVTAVVDALTEGTSAVTTIPAVENVPLFNVDTATRTDLARVVEDTLAAARMRLHSPLATLLRGVLMTRLECLQCNTVSAHADTFATLHLPIPNTNCSLADCVAKFLEVESLDVESKSTAACNCTGAARKKSLRILFTPDALIITLVRFSKEMDEHGTFVQSKKNTSVVHYPLLFVSPDGSSYELSAVVLHHGETPNSGHYVAIVKLQTGRGGERTWFQCDDTSVTAVEQAQVLGKKDAYVLFYERVAGK